MAFINGRPNSLECRVVYWGPGLSGRSSNLDHIRRALVPAGQSQGPGLSLEIGEHRGLKVRVRLSTGEELQLFTGRSVTGILYLGRAERGGRWSDRWTDGASLPPAIGLLVDGDTLTLRIGDRG